MKKILFAFAAVLLFLDLSGSDYKTLMKQGAAAVKKKNFELAQQKYSEAYGAAGNAEEKYQNVIEQARCLSALKRVDERKKLLEGELRKPEYLPSQKQQMLHRLASQYLWGKNYDYALDKLNLALSIDGGVDVHSVLYFSLCHYACLIYYHKKKEYEPIILLMEPLTDLCQYDVNRIVVYTMLGNAYAKLNRTEDAVKNYRLAIKLGKQMKTDTSKLEQELRKLTK